MRILRPLARVALAALGVLMLLPVAPAAADDGARLEPNPPWIFFPDPDEKTAAEIDELIANSFADLNKVVFASDQLVRRYGVVSVPRLAEEMRRDVNEPLVWNSELTCWALRDRYGPARELWPLLEPLTTLLRSPDPWRRAFAALALGSFHGPETIPEDRGVDTVVHVRDPATIARADLREGGLVLSAALPAETLGDVRVAMALALAKRGDGPEGDSRRAILSPQLWDDSKGYAAHQAVLVALGLLPGPGDEERFLDDIHNGQGQIRRAAALGLALQLVQDRPPAWRVGVDRILRALKSDPIRPLLEDGWEAVFARGVIAARGNAPPEEWSSLYDVAIDPSAKAEASTAAVQTLIFCPEAWLPDRVTAHLKSGSGVADPVLAAFLLIAGRSGTKEGVAACRDYLGNKGRRPTGKEDWDVRFHAAVGLLRAFAAGSFTSPEARADALSALEAAVGRGLEPGEFRSRLERLLARRRDVLADPALALSDADVRNVEEGFVCPYGLMSRHIEDMVLVRLNDFVPTLFNIRTRKATPGQPDKTEMPQRFLKNCLDRHPYFRRDELQAARGLRPVERMQGGEHEVRNPK